MLLVFLLNPHFSPFRIFFDISIVSWTHPGHSKSSEMPAQLTPAATEHQQISEESNEMASIPFHALATCWAYNYLRISTPWADESSVRATICLWGLRDILWNFFAHTMPELLGCFSATISPLTCCFLKMTLHNDLCFC